MAQKTNDMWGHTYELVTAPAKVNAMYKAWTESWASWLEDCYGRYSYAKRNAFQYCRHLEHDAGSNNGVITSYNNMMFTYAFTAESEGRKYLVYITPNHDYIMDVTDID